MSGSSTRISKVRARGRGALGRAALGFPRCPPAIFFSLPRLSAARLPPPTPSLVARLAHVTAGVQQRAGGAVSGRGPPPPPRAGAHAPCTPLRSHVASAEATAVAAGPGRSPGGPAQALFVSNLEGDYIGSRKSSFLSRCPGTSASGRPRGQVSTPLLFQNGG